MKREMRLLAAGLAACLTLAGCSATGDNGDPVVFAQLQSFVTGGNAPKAVPRYEALAQTHTPGMSVFDEETGVQNVLRQEAVSGGGVHSWISPRGTVFSTRNGMLVATRGLGDDIMEMDASETLALVSAGQSGKATRFVARLDGNNRIVNETFICEIERDGPYMLELQGRKIQTTHLTETCYGPRYDFTNLYWVDQSGKVWQSRQFTGKLTGMMTFRELDTAGIAMMTRRAAEHSGGKQP